MDAREPVSVLMEYALVYGEVGRVVRKNHFGDKELWMLDMAIDNTSILLRWVPAKECTPLDPSLNVLFERKEND